MEERDYSLLPEPVWLKMRAWFGLSAGSQPIPRCVSLILPHSSIQTLRLLIAMSDCSSIIISLYTCCLIPGRERVLIV